MNKKADFFFTSIIALLLLVSCSNPSQSNKSPTIKGSGWVIENIDQNWWSTPHTATAFFSIGISFEDSSLVASDFSEIIVTSPDGGSWIFDQSDINYYFDSSSGSFGNYQRCYSSSWDNGNYVQIGNYDVEVILDNGQSDTATIFMPAPGSTSTNGDTVAYTEDCSNAGSPPSNYARLPLRGTITSATNDGTTVSVAFNVNDSNVYSGHFWFYDATGDYIGGSENYFRNYNDGTIESTVNGGSAWYNNGASNVVNYIASDIYLISGSSISDIAKVCVVLTDGQQYHLQSYTFDTRSISRMWSVTPL